METTNIKIEKLDDFGRGITYIDDKIVFINNALKDEVVDICITKDLSKYMEADVVNYNKISPLRVEPICPYYNKCGGCHLMHLSYEEQLKYKKEKVETALHRICKLENVTKDIIYDKSINYRNKATLKVKNDIGFYERNTTEVVPIEFCYLLNDKINKLIKIINEKLNISNIKEIIIKAYTSETMVVFVGENLEEENLLEIKEYVDSIYTYNVTYKHIYGKTRVKEELKDIKLLTSPDAFLQVNTKMCLKMYDKVLSLIKKDSILLDLYCGVGSIGLYVSKKCKEVVGVELNHDAVEDANENKKLNDINNIKFFHGQANEILPKLKKDFNCIIVDPPRAGLDNKTIELLKNFKAKNIIYISCDLMTLTRDISILKDKYKVIEVIPVDMFPNTYHIENIVKLELIK